MNIEKTRIELEKRLAHKTNTYIELQMKSNGETVYVEPKFNNTFYVYYSEIHTGKNYSNLIEVAKALCNYQNEIKKIEEENDNYVFENIPKLHEYFNKYIKGKKREEIEPEILDCYFDWYKDVYGFRPRNIFA